MNPDRQIVNRRTENLFDVLSDIGGLAVILHGIGILFVYQFQQLTVIAQIAEKFYTIPNPKVKK